MAPSQEWGGVTSTHMIPMGLQENDPDTWMIDTSIRLHPIAPDENANIDDGDKPK